MIKILLLAFNTTIIIACIIGLLRRSLYLLRRNTDVYNLRIHILFNCPRRAYENLPSYDEMIYSKRPLTVEEWVKEEDRQ